MILPVRRPFLVVYVLWISLCGALFAALSGADDPSRRRDRILNDVAEVRAVAELQRVTGLRGYEAVHIAYASRGEGGTEARWIVLLDRVPHTALRDARVVELRASDGALLGIREPR
jgi:hypothetical protein